MVEQLNLRDPCNWVCDEKNFRLINSDKWITEAEARVILTNAGAGTIPGEEDEIDFILDNTLLQEELDWQEIDNAMAEDLYIYDGIGGYGFGGPVY